MKQPSALLLENVKGLVGHDGGKTLDTMVGVLNDIGYVVDFDVLNSKYFGVPQNRERIFIVAVREDLIESEEWLFTKGQTIVPKGKRRISGYDWAKVFNFDFPNSETEHDHYTKSQRDRIRAAQRILNDNEASQTRKNNAKKRIEVMSEVVDKYSHLKPIVKSVLRDVLEVSVDEKYYLDEERTLRLVAELEEKNKRVGTVGHHPFSKKFEFKGYNSEISPSLIATDYKAPKTVLEGVPQMVGEQVPRWIPKPNEINRTLRSGGKASLSDKHNYDHIAVEVERGLPIKEATKQGYAVACEGNAVNFQFPESKTRRGRVGREIANTLEASSINQGTPIKAGNKYRIRKLTPLECFRLQGFSDETHQTLVEAGLSDSQRYKQAGNAVTVNVIKALIERLIPYI